MLIDALKVKSKSIRLSDQNNGRISVVLKQVSVIPLTYLEPSKSFLLTSKEYFFKHYNLFCGKALYSVSWEENAMVMNQHYGQTMDFEETAAVIFKIKILSGAQSFKTSFL